jgi:hypothetical protein
MIDMKEREYKLTVRRDDSILITMSYGPSLCYPYNETFGYMEVSGDFDRSSFLVTEKHYRLMGHANDPLANWQSRERAISYTSQEAIEGAESLLQKQIKSLREVIQTGRLHPAYAAMLPHAKEIIKHYGDDFYFWDSIALSRQNPARFIWIVRTCGSQLYTNNSGDVLTCLKFYANKKNSDERQEFYYWNGTTLQQIMPDQAVQDYLEKLPAWHAELQPA